MSLASIDNKTQNFCIFPVDFHRWLCLLCFPELNFFSFLQGDNHQVRTTVWYLHYLSHVTLHTNINPAQTLSQAISETRDAWWLSPYVNSTAGWFLSGSQTWIWTWIMSMPTPQSGFPVDQTNVWWSNMTGRLVQSIIICFQRFYAALWTSLKHLHTVMLHSDQKSIQFMAWPDYWLCMRRWCKWCNFVVFASIAWVKGIRL